MRDVVLGSTVGRRTTRATYPFVFQSKDGFDTDVVNYNTEVDYDTETNIEAAKHQNAPHQINRQV